MKMPGTVHIPVGLLSELRNRFAAARLKGLKHFEIQTLGGLSALGLNNNDRRPVDICPDFAARTKPTADLHKIALAK